MFCPLYYILFPFMQWILTDYLLLKLDHLLEQDLYLHSLQCLEIILRDESCYDILLDLGMPILHRNVRYNCRVVGLLPPLPVNRSRRKIDKYIICLHCDRSASMARSC